MPGAVTQISPNLGNNFAKFRQLFFLPPKSSFCVIFRILHFKKLFFSQNIFLYKKICFDFTLYTIKSHVFAPEVKFRQNFAKLIFFAKFYFYRQNLFSFARFAFFGETFAVPGNPGWKLFPECKDERAALSFSLFAS